MLFSEHINPITSGDYEVRLIKNKEELEKYQKLRYDYLILEFDPKRQDEIKTDLNGDYDEENSQLCVFYHNPETGRSEVAGGYVLMRFKDENSFCKTSLEYDLHKLLEGHRYEIVETSRAVIHPDHRNGIALRLLWSGVIEYTKKYNLRYVIGTTSFKGTDTSAYPQAAGYLYHNYLMPEHIRVFAKEPSAEMNMLPKEKIDRDIALREMPGLLRGYLMMGCEVGDGFFIDKEFGSVDVFTILDMQKYGRYKLK